MENEKELSLQIKSYGEATDEDLKKINKFTLQPLTKEDVFVFPCIVGTNEATDDRNYVPFDLEALKDMKKLYLGKSLIKGHKTSDVDGQVGRVYDSELVTTDKMTSNGEALTELHLKVYIPVTDANKELIEKIKNGIHSELSTSTVPKKVICNICNTDNRKKWCPHFPGKTYRVENGTPNGQQKVCYLLLSGTSEVNELSLVVVPAQKRARITKAAGIDEIIKNKISVRLIEEGLRNADFFMSKNK